MRHYFDNTGEYNSTWFYAHAECLVDSKIIIEVKLIIGIGTILLNSKVNRIQS